MELRKPYNECKPKEYEDLKEFFSTKIVFSKNDDCDLIKKRLILKRRMLVEFGSCLL